MRRFNLSEGMWVGDLTDLVQPLISVDEYKSKIDDTAIVIGFYIQDRDAADDLNRFIQKSPVSFVDCEVSPAPDQRGYYIVFVELPYNDRMVANIGSLLSEISPLVGIENWQVKCRNLKGIVRFDSDKLERVLKANHLSDKIKSLKVMLNKIRKDKAEQEALAAKADQIAQEKADKAVRDKIAKQNNHKKVSSKESAPKTTHKK